MFTEGQRMGRIRCFWALMMAMAISSGLIYIFYHRFFIVEMGVGWSLAFVNGMVAFEINRNAVANEPGQALFWGLGMNGARAMTFLIIVFLFHSIDVLNFMPFLAAALVGYFCFLFCEILALHSRSLKVSIDK